MYSSFQAACLRRARILIRVVRLRLAYVNELRVLRSFMCTAFERSYWLTFLLCGGKHSVAQKVESGTSVHGALDGLQPIDLSLDRTGAPGQCQGGMYGIVILTQTRP